MCIYIKNNLASRELDEFPVFQSKDLEQIWCSIKISKNEDMLLGCIYKPPLSNDKINDDLLNSLKLAAKLCKEGNFNTCLICGDFNIPNLDWKSAPSYSYKAGINSFTREFVNV